MASLSLIFQIPSLPFPTLLWAPGDWLRWTASPRLLCPLASCGFAQWGKEEDQRVRKKELSGHLFLQLPVCWVTFGRDCVPLPVSHLLLGCPFRTAPAFTRPCSPFHFRPQDGSNFLLLAQACCKVPCRSPSLCPHLQFHLFNVLSVACQDPG